MQAVASTSQTVSEMSMPSKDEAHVSIAVPAPPIARLDSTYSFSELDSSCETSSPTRSVCSEEVTNIDQAPHLCPVERGDALSFDVIASICASVGQYLLCQIERCKMSPSPNPFDALSEPKITIPCYFERIRQYSQATPETILCAVVLIRRISRQTGLVVTNLNVHRLLVTAIMVFAKFYDDEIDSNARWARIAGVKKVEMNNLEVEFLNRCQFDLRVTPEEFHEVVYEISAFRNSPRPSIDGSEENSPSSNRSGRSSNVWTFHAVASDKNNSLQRTKSHHEGYSSASQQPRSSTHSIMAFFHHTNHAHLNRFPKACSPTSTNLPSPGMGGPMMSPGQIGAYESAPPSPHSVSADNTPTNRPVKHRTIPRGPSLQHIAAMLHGASPFLHLPHPSSSKEPSSSSVTAVINGHGYY
jgi:hypothetical protein